MDSLNALNAKTNADTTFLVIKDEPAPASWEVGDLVATGIRHKRTLGCVFSGIVLLGLLTALSLPLQYQSEAKILVDHERLNPLLTPAATTQVEARQAVAKEEMNSEVELMRSQQLLRNVVAMCGLENASTHPRDQERKIGEALERLRNRLTIEAVPRTNIISIAYTSHSPELSKRVVDTVVNLYLQKHVAAHSMSGQLEFFDQQVPRYHKELQDAEAALAAFSGGERGVLAPASQRDESLRRENEFIATLAQTHSAIVETRERIRTLQKEVYSTPARVTTQLKNSDNPQLMQDMKSTLLRLQLKRTELLTKYQPSYRLVQEVDRQIANTQAALVSAIASPLEDQTTDVNPTHQWIDSELAKATAELRSLQSRESETAKIVGSYDRNAHQLDLQNLRYQDLTRTAKAAEENYLLYQKKREEARISNALDERRLLNVSVIDPATQPYFPMHSAVFYIVVSVLIAVLLTMGLLLALDRFENTFRNPRELERFTASPVLASVPLDFLTPSRHLS